MRDAACCGLSVAVSVAFLQVDKNEWRNLKCLEDGEMIKDQVMYGLLTGMEPFLVGAEISQAKAMSSAWLFDDSTFWSVFVTPYSSTKVPEFRPEWDRNKYKKLLWPFCWGLHWQLLIFNFERKTIQCMCSLGRRDCVTHLLGNGKLW